MHLLDRMANWFCNISPAASKEGDVVKGILFIVGIVFVVTQSVIWCLSWLVGISMWWRWAALVAIYLVYIAYAHWKISK